MGNEFGTLSNREIGKVLVSLVNNKLYIPSSFFSHSDVVQ